MNVNNLAFYIGKSSNSNVTIYSYNIADEKNNLIDLFQPLDYYWIMREKEDSPREDLTFIEKTIYSYKIVTSDPNDIAIKINALPDDTIHIQKIDNKYHAVVSLPDANNNHKDVYLKKVFCHLSGTLGTFVESIDIIYQDPDTKKLHTLSRSEGKGIDSLTKK
jgi:hypothetical protein